MWGMQEDSVNECRVGMKSEYMGGGREGSAKVQCGVEEPVW